MEERHKFYRSLLYPTLFVMLMWAVKCFEFFTDIDLSELGTYPRKAYGMVGIISSPFIHGDFAHLMSNSLPIIILGALIIYFYPTAAKKVIPGIYFLTGIAVWLLARPVYHIGASGLVYGFAFFLFFSGVFRNDIKSLAISFFIIFMYGGIVWGLLPVIPGVSWESHLYGAIAGSLFAFLFRSVDLPPKELWQNEDDLQSEVSYRYIYVPKEKTGESSAQPESNPGNEQTGGENP